MIVGRRVLGGHEVVEVVEVQRRRQGQRGLHVVGVAVGHDLEAAGPQPVEERPIVDLVLQLERARGAVPIEDQEPDVAARTAAAADRRGLGRVPAGPRDLGGHDRDEGEHDQDRRHDVERAGHARQPQVADPDSDDEHEHQEDGPADLQEARLDAERTEHAGQVAVQQQRRDQGGHDQGGAATVTKHRGTHQQQR